MPTAIIFKTTGNNSATPDERFRISSTGAWAIEGSTNYGSPGQVLTSNGNDSPTWQNSGGGGSLTVDNKTSGYSLQASDAGKLITMTTGDLTVPYSSSGVFSAGDVVTIHNKSSSTFAILQASNVSLRFAGSNLSGNRDITQRGIATITCIAANQYIISGSGLI